MSGRSEIHIGVAGWDYPDWKGVLYPPRRPSGFDPLHFLARFIDVIEVNSTYYHPVRPDVADRWVERVEDHPHFRYTAKLWKRFTHERKTAWTRDDVVLVRKGLARLARAGRLDAVLAQFPWSFKNEEASRDWLADVIDAFEEFPLVVEVRHESWNVPEFYAWLTERGVGFVNVDQPLFSRSIKPSATSTSHTGYVRVHGRNYQDWFRKGAGRDARYDYLYSEQELRRWVERTKEIAEDPQTSTVDVVFNNHYKAQAVVNAIQFKHLLDGEVVPAPPRLFEAYPDALDGHAFPDSEE